jgi:Xaa-Pro aminopeptidase
MTPTIENNGAPFDEKLLIAAQDKLKQGVEFLASKIKPGMTEAEALILANEIFKSLNYEKYWHAPKIRFGSNTLKSFSEISDSTVHLDDDDMFFLDFGVVFQGHESDYGRTFILGKNHQYEALKNYSEKLFQTIKNAWTEEHLSGVDLYKLAATEAAKNNYIFNLRDGTGHRIGDFPHHVHFRGDLAEVNFNPTPNRWILEVQIQDPKTNRGAFFEDIL